MTKADVSEPELTAMAPNGSGITDVYVMVRNARRLREKYLSDPYRPGYHFVAPEGIHLPIDPNATIHWKGRYHLFYIYFNYQDGGRKQLWGHVSSIDLVHWRHHPPALAPDADDTGAVNSGGVFVDKNGVPTITYWGTGKTDGVCIATSTDELLDRWIKHPFNPVIPSTEFGVSVVATPGGGQVIYGIADPSQVWVHEGRYYLLTGNLFVLREFGEEHIRRRINRELGRDASGRDRPTLDGRGGKAKRPEGDTAYLFVSDDLAHWTYLREFYQSDRKWTRDYEDCMCPDFFPLPSSPTGGAPSGRYMLLFISHTHCAQYYIGTYADDRYYPETHGRMTWVDKRGFGPPETLLDARGRRIMWAMIAEDRSLETRDASGWSGELGLPQLLWLGGDGTLRMRPIPELACLRYNYRTWRALAVPDGGELPLSDFMGNSFELQIELSSLAAHQFGVEVCRSPGGEETTSIYYDADDATLIVDTRRSSLGDGVKVTEAAPFKLGEGEPLSLRIFVDKSVVEVFANDRLAVARRIYPSRPDSLGVSLFARGGNVEAARVDAWDMMPSNPC
jgi:beta-fructofuranosidase